jgi:hypothetical protein
MSLLEAGHYGVMLRYLLCLRKQLYQTCRLPSACGNPAPSYPNKMINDDIKVLSVTTFAIV